MLTSQSRTTLTWGSAISAILLAMTFVGLIPISLSALGAFVTLTVMSTILVFEGAFEEAQRRKVPVMKVLRGDMSFPTALLMFLAIIGYILAVLMLFGTTLPPEVMGAAALIVSFQAFAVVWERYH